MMVSAVGARDFPTRNPVMEMAPMGRRHILGIDAERFDRVDRFQNTLDFGPTGKPEQDFAARPYARDCGDRRSGFGGAQNVDTGGDRSMVIRRPADEGKDAAGENETMRRRRSMMRSCVIWPNRIQRSTRPFCQ